MNFIPLNGWPQLKEISEQLEHFREVYARFAKVNRWYQSIEETELIGNPVIFEKALKLNATALSVDLLPIQSGSGDPSPTNVRPISGRTSVNVVNASVIKSTSDFEAGSYFADGSKNNTAENLRIRVRSNSIFMLPAGSYVINCTTTKSKTVQMAWNLWENGTYGTNTRTYNSGWVTLGGITLEEDSYFSIAFRYSDDSDISLSDLTISIVEPAADITIALGQTVYGGTLDVKTGVLTITHVLVDLGTLAWTKVTNKANVYFATTIADIKGATSVNLLSGSICSQYKQITANTMNNTAGQDVCFANYGQLLWVCDSTYSDGNETAFTTAMDGVQLCYELATPTTVQLTPKELEMLKGYNLISTDADSLTVKAYTI